MPYYTPEELSIDCESIERHKDIMKQLEMLTSDMSKRHALYKQSATINQTWTLTAYQWRAWKRRRTAILAWNMAHE